MPPWLLVWIARWNSDERFRKATSEDYRFQFGSLFIGGVFMVAATMFGHSFLEHAIAMRIWICATIAISVLVFGAITWTRWIPAEVSLELAIVAWGAFVWIVLR